MGLFLVFDLDQTIIDSKDNYFFKDINTAEEYNLYKKKIRESLNWNVINILSRASKLRPHMVSAICLLTNNSYDVFVSAVDEVIRDITGSVGKYKTYTGNADAKTMPDKPYFFDSIMMFQHSSRKYDANKIPVKSILDIAHMATLIGIKLPNIKDVYFFDDIGTHRLRSEFNFMSDGKYKDHYIQITPPYSNFRKDNTSYASILKGLSDLDGYPAELPTTVKPTTVKPTSVKATSVKATVVGRPRSNNVNSANLNRNFPPPPESASISAPVKRRPLMTLNMFNPPNVKHNTTVKRTRGGTRKLRRH